MFKVVSIILLVILCSVKCILSETDYCSFESRNCEKHIACTRHKPSISLANFTFTITINEFSESAKQTLLNFINNERNNLANGTNEIGVKGANFPITVWSNELDNFAKRFLEFDIMDDNPDDFCSKTVNAKTVKFIRMIDVDSFDSDKIAHLLVQQNGKIVSNRRELNRMSHWFSIGGAFLIAESGVKKHKEIVFVHGYNVDNDKLETMFVEGEPCSKCEGGFVCDDAFKYLCKQ